MLYGKLAIPPVRNGATVKSVDDNAAKKVPGFVKAVVVDDKTGTTSGWVVAVASSYEGAKKAAAALKVDWDKGPYAKVSNQSIIDESRRLQKEGTEGLLYVKNGDSAAAMQKAAKVIEAEYLTTLNIHAPMEPMNALAFETGRHLAHLYRQSVQHAHNRDRGCHRRYGPQKCSDPSAIPGRRLRSSAGVGHGDTGGRRGQGGRQTGEAHLCPRRRHADGFHPTADLPKSQSRTRRRRA